MAKDYIGQELSVGDIVIITEPDYRSLVTGVITKITKCKCLVTYHNKLYGKDVGTYREFNQIIRKPIDK